LPDGSCWVELREIGKWTSGGPANEAELHSLYQTSDFDTALKQLRIDVNLGIVTRSEKGCVVASTDGVTAVPAFPIDKMVDTTGAGDLFAAGFLFGLVRGAGHQAAGRLGALAAAEVIQHIGARPQTSLKELAQQNGLGLRRAGHSRESWDIIEDFRFSEISLDATPKSASYFSRPVPQRGVGHRHERWDGMRWTRQRQA
jgi:pfkB family carbohydrate kinase